MSTSRHLVFGEAGEDIAARHLANKGMEIVARRVRLSRGELDIVARDGREWVFVEVKARRDRKRGGAVDAFSGVKVRRFLRAVMEYVNRHSLHDQPMRFDVVTIDFGGGDVPEVVHYPAAINADGQS